MHSTSKLMKSVLLLLAWSSMLAVQAKGANDEAPILKQPVEAAKEAVKSISSIFAGLAPQKSGHQQCCGGDCPPGACDVNRVVPTDLSYAYPAPTLPAHKSSWPSVAFPCCGPNCPDGACQTKGPSSISPTPTLPRFRRPSGGVNVVVGCCDTCSDCDQTTVASVTSSAKHEEATGAAAAIAEKIGVNEFSVGICIGCWPCRQCRAIGITSYLSFFAHPTGHPGAGEADRLIATNSASTTTATTSHSSSSSPNAEPTYILGDDVVSAINGQNQDVLPIIIQSHTNKISEPITLLAQVDLKVTENYFSHRLLSHLGLDPKSTAYPKGLSPSPAVIPPDRLEVTVNSTILLDVLTGHDDAQLFKNVRFQIHTPKKLVDAILVDVPDVVLGTKFLAAVGGLTVYPEFRDSVKQGVKVVYPAHEGELDKRIRDVDEKKDEGVKHEEL